MAAHVRAGEPEQALASMLTGILLYNSDRPRHARITQGRIPITIIDPAHKMRAAR